MSDERVAISIAGSSLSHGLKASLPAVRLDGAKLITAFIAGGRLLRTYPYYAPLDQSRDPLACSRQQASPGALRTVGHVPWWMPAIAASCSMPAMPTTSGATSAAPHLVFLAHWCGKAQWMGGILALKPGGVWRKAGYDYHR